ncbi:MAG: chitobiase/beta-hexosaminidase C-terminal domain-containing protein, partial [Pirellulales bacterium]|nr:chitobiase/beta-hexosaminidase C-terminal domain-containing protein [Pirellulales bacterium]
MASNDATLTDYAGDYPDWIEIHNPTESPIDLAGWYLTDASTDLTRWQFPSAPVSVLDPDEYLVIFASSKDGEPDIPDTELHTNFSLNAGGEYLGLVMPDGYTIVHEYAPIYPKQLTDISYGADGKVEIDDSFIGEGAGAAMLIPTDGLLGTSWTGGQPFDDSSWQDIEIGVGYDVNSQGTTHLLSATNNNSIDPNDVYVLHSGSLFDGEVVNIDRTHLFANLPIELQGLDYVLTANDDKLAGPGFSVDLTFDPGTTLYLSIDSRVGDNNQYDGPTLGNGVMDWVLTQGWTDTGLTWNKANETATPFHVYSLTPMGTSHTFYEQNNGAARNMYSIAGGTSQSGNLYEGLITTNLEELMYDQTTTVYLRIPFDVADPNVFSLLTLNIHYDDGFVAYLNGVKIAERNAPPDPSFDSFASASHPDTQALIPEPIDVSAHLGDLVSGENILAIHGLNVDSTSTDFLILPFLTATRTMVSPATYYTTPTPGEINVPGALGLVGDTEFSMDRGFYDAPFSVEITTDTAEAEIRYTRDGSIPTATTGLVYTEPIMIASTTILRAAAFKPGYLSTNVDTQTYLFLDDVFQQNETFGIDGTGLAPYAAWGHSGPDWEV